MHFHQEHGHSGTKSRNRLNTQRQPASSPSITFDFYEATVTMRCIGALRGPAHQEKGTVISQPIAAFMLVVTLEISSDFRQKLLKQQGTWNTNAPSMLGPPTCTCCSLLSCSPDNSFIPPGTHIFQLLPSTSSVPLMLRQLSKWPPICVHILSVACVLVS